MVKYYIALMVFGWGCLFSDTGGIAFANASANSVVASASEPSKKAVNKVKVTRRMLKAAEGVWERKGYGEVIEVNEQGVQFLQFNPEGCLLSASLMVQFLQLENSQLQAAQMPNFLARFNVKTDKSALTIGAVGATENYDQHYQPLPELPKVCANGLDISSDPVVVFDYFWRMFERYYAFFERREVNWVEQYAKYRSTITVDTTPKALFNSLSQMVAPLKDAHVSIETDQQWFNTERKSAFYHQIGETEDKLRSLGVSDDDVLKATSVDYSSYLVKQTASILLPTSKHIVGTESDAAMVWGVTEQNIGVIKINKVEGFAGELASPAEEVAAVHQLMPTVIDALGQTKGIMIDLRYNSGGMDVVSTAIASYFAPQRVLAYRKRPYNTDADWRNVYLTPAEKPYLKPLFVVTSLDTVSGGEVLTLALKSLPNTLHIGETTQGALSDLLPAALPNGWHITLSNEIYSDAAGRIYEQVGIEPEVVLPVYNRETKTQSSQPLRFVESRLGN